MKTLFSPSADTVEASQMTAFRRFCEERTGANLRDWTAFHAFSVERFRQFWPLFIAWSGLSVEGDLEPVCSGDAIETCEFFPQLRLSFVANLLSGEGLHGEGLAILALDEAGERRTVTRAELTARVLTVARALRASGIGPGDRVCAVASSTVETVVACLASLALGATWSSLSPDIGLDGMTSRLDQVEPRLLWYDGAYLQQGARVAVHDKLAALLEALPTVERTVALRGDVSEALRRTRSHDATTLLEIERAGADAVGPRSLDELPRLPWNHPLYVLFSSGTTGKPKCIVHGAGGTLVEHHKEHRLHSDLRPGDRLYFHTTPAWMMWNWLLSALACRTAIVLYEGAAVYPEADALWRIVAKEKITVFGTSPSYLELSRDQGLRPTTLGLGALRCIQSTGSVLPEAMFHWVSENVGAIPLQSISGGTDLLGCLLLGNPNLPVVAGELQCKSLGLDVGVVAAPVPADCRAREPLAFGELVCRTPFPSRPLGFLADPGGHRFHAAYFAENDGVWTHGDWIELSRSGGARVHGRSDGVINVRGVRIGPAEIYHALEAIPEIAQSMAIGQVDAAEAGGVRLVLLVVLNREFALDGALRRRIGRRILERASNAHVPAVIVAVADLPTTYNGKRSERAATEAINRRPVTNLAALRNPGCLDEIVKHPALRQADAAPVCDGGNALETMRAIWRDLLGVPVADDDRFFDLGGHSLMAVKLLARVHKAFGISLPMSALVVETPTLRSMASAIERGPFRRASTLVPFADGVGLPAYWVPGGGGLSVLMFREASRYLGADRPVFGFEQPLSLHDSPDDAATLARRYVTDLRVHKPDGPYVLLGFSFGGWTALEMTRQIEASGGRVALLVVFDTEIPRELTLAQIARSAAYRARYHAMKVSALKAAEVLPYAKSLVDVAQTKIRSRLGQVDALANREAIEEVRALDKKNRRILLRYSQEKHAPVRARIAFVHALTTSKSALPPDLDPRSGWGAHTTGGVEVVRVKGSHLSMLRSPHLEDMIRNLRELLSRVDALESKRRSSAVTEKLDSKSAINALRHEEMA